MLERICRKGVDMWGPPHEAVRNFLSLLEVAWTEDPQDLALGASGQAVGVLASI